MISDSLGHFALWRAGSDPERTRNDDGTCTLVCRSDDPSVISPVCDVPASDAGVLLVRMSATPPSGIPGNISAMAVVYHATHEHPEFSEERTTRFPVRLDGRIREYIVPLNSFRDGDTRLRRLRFDPLDTPGICVVHGFAVRPMAGVRILEDELLTQDQVANLMHLRRQTAGEDEICMGLPEADLILSNSLSPPEIRRLPLQGNGPPFSTFTREAADKISRDLFPFIRRVRLWGYFKAAGEEEKFTERIVSMLSQAHCLAEVHTAETDIEAGSFSMLRPVLSSLTFHGDETTALSSYGESAGFFRKHFSRGRNLVGRNPNWAVYVSFDTDNLERIVETVRKAAKLGAARIQIEIPGDLAGEDLFRSEITNRINALLEPERCRTVEIRSVPEDAKTPEERPWCLAPWSRIFIGPDGAVHACANSRLKAVSDLSQASHFFEIWNCDDYRSLRRNLARGEISGVCRDCAIRITTGLIGNGV